MANKSFKIEIWKQPAIAKIIRILVLRFETIEQAIAFADAHTSKDEGYCLTEKDDY